LSELILVVEDRPLNAKLLRDVLRANGFQVIEAATGEDGVALARERVPALVLMDIQLPGMDGIAALRELKARPETAKIPVIAVTASALPMERQQILDAGFDGYQSKPLRVQEMLGEVRRLLARAPGDRP